MGVRGFLPKHEVRTIAEMQWPEQLENGELINAAERAGFDVMLTADQSIPYQQNLWPQARLGSAQLQHLVGGLEIRRSDIGQVDAATAGKL